MKIIKLTSTNDSRCIYINAEAIGHFYDVPSRIEYGRFFESYRVVGTTCHNNGGFHVKETVEQILELINTKTAL